MGSTHQYTGLLSTTQIRNSHADLHQGEASVSQCLVCESSPESPNPDCEEGNDNVPRSSCGVENSGCVVMKFKYGTGRMHWARDCCYDCWNDHTANSNKIGYVASVECDTDNCNTMDPFSN